MKQWILAAAALLLALAPFSGGDLARSGESAERPESIFAVIHSPGEAWEAEVPFRDQPLVMLHVRYMMELLEQGTLVVGGPFLDDSGGMAVLRADDIEAARKLAAADPSVEAGLLSFELRPWMIAMWDDDHSGGD